MKNAQADYMKCSFCDWRVKRFITVNGRKVHGGGKLAHHVETTHHGEFMEIIEWAEPGFPETKTAVMGARP